MVSDEFCAVAHVDISPRTSLEEGERLLHRFVEGATESAGVIELSVLKQPTRTNHFEIIGRYRSQDAYLAHLVCDSNLELRTGIAPMLGSPYEDRLHRPRGDERWPSAMVGDFVVLTQLELRPELVATCGTLLDDLAGAQLAETGNRGQVLLQRRTLDNNLELLSVWSSAEDFDSHLGSRPVARAREALGACLVAPIDDRRHHLLSGSWSVS